MVHLFHIEIKRLFYLENKRFNKYKEKRDKRRIMVINFSHMSSVDTFPNRYIDNKIDYLYEHIKL
jgi:hypothetical protein